MRLSYKYKVYRQNRNHLCKIERMLSLSSWVYNHCIALHRRYYRLYGKGLNCHKLKVHLTKVKKQEKYKDWNELSSQTIQSIAEKIEEGYKKFFRKENKRPPSFRGKKKYRSLMFKTTGWKLSGNIFTVNSCKLPLKFFKSREPEGKVCAVTLKKDSVGDIWLCFSLKEVPERSTIKTKTGKTAGFDFGLKNFLTTSDNKKYEAPIPLMNNLKELKRRSGNLSRKKKGSKSRERSKVALARLHRRISNQREDFHWKSANDLVGKYDTLCFEDLNIKGMKGLWGRKISDYGFSDFLLKSEHLAKKHHKKFLKVDRWYPSSKTCFDCRYLNNALRLADRTWCCPGCGTNHDRDLNASKNIWRVGTSTREGETIRPALAGRFP